MSTLTLSPAFRPVALPSRPASRPAARPASRPVQRSTVRLTRRGRLVVFAASLVLAFAVGVIVAAGSVATGQAGTPEPTRIVTVGSGETLWGIASEMADPGQTRTMMTRIQHLNALESGALIAGQRLVVPAD